MDDVGSSNSRDALLSEGQTYFNDAIQNIGSSDASFEAKLTAVLNMQMYQAEAMGAKASYATLLLGDLFTVQAFGPHPTLNLDSPSVGLQIFAYLDTIRSLCINNQRPLFNLVETTPCPDTLSSSLSIPALCGLPKELLFCISQISRLEFDREGMEQETFVEKRASIEKKLREWQPSAYVDVLDDGGAALDLCLTHEMWRQTALVHFYQTLYHYGPLASPLRHCLHQLLSLGSMADPLDATSTTSTNRGWWPKSADRAGPWFFAATIAVSEEDRNLCRRGLSICQPSERLGRDNLAAAEKLWEVTDEEGWTLDWRTVLERAGMNVEFG